ncbi:MAG TPA: hypothetical protein VFU31_19290 [Candidatus Binatia bacterium]|nr:hypothetical protein [Candidatus Binatia bacterium]
MARYPIYADSFGQLGNQLQQDQIMQQRAIEESQRNFMRAREQQQQQANYERQMAYRQAMDQQALQRQAMLDRENSRYLDWQMSADGQRAKMPTQVITETARQAAETARATGNAVSPAARKVIGDELADMIDAEAMNARPGLRREYERELNVANTENLRASGKKRLGEAQKAVSNAGWTRKLLSRLTPFYELPEYGWLRDAEANAAELDSRYPSYGRDAIIESTDVGPRGRRVPIMDVEPWMAEEIDPRKRRAPMYAPETGFDPAAMRRLADPLGMGMGGQPGYAPPAQRGGAKFPPEFYQAVNALIAQGVSPVEAKRQVMAQFSP